MGIGATSPLDKHIKKMDLESYIQTLGTAATLVPSVLDRSDLELIFDTIINERIEETALGGASSASGSLSYEEFKKSIVRVASLCKVVNEKVQMEMGEAKTLVTLKK